MYVGLRRLIGLFWGNAFCPVGVVRSGRFATHDDTGFIIQTSWKLSGHLANGVRMGEYESRFEVVEENDINKLVWEIF